MMNKKNLLFVCWLWLAAQPMLYAQQPGAMQLHKYLPRLQGRQVALVINQTSLVGDSLLLDVLLARGVQVKKIFVPEHGFRGQADAGAHIADATDSATGIPVISLYGAHRKPVAEDMAGVDVVVYDLQDVGVRFYTYISTLEYCMEACAQHNARLMVLDRPDPNGFYVDGPVLEPENKSFVGMQPIPVVYGMTAGEYAQMLKGEQWVAGAEQLRLQIIPCKDYEHIKRYNLPVWPSPNLRTMAAIYAYPSLCLFEGTPVSVGRGTPLPFQQYGCPEFEGRFNYSFTPQSVTGAKSPPYEGRRCYGEQVGTDENEVLGRIDMHLYLDWLIRAYNAYPDKDKFFTPFFTKLAGTTQLAQQIKAGKTVEEIRTSWQPGLEAFRKIRKKYLLYPDVPESFKKINTKY